MATISVRARARLCLALALSWVVSVGLEASAQPRPRQPQPRVQRPRAPRITASCDSTEWVAEAPDELEVDPDELTEAARIAALPDARALAELSRRIESVDALRAAVTARDPLGTRSYTLLLAHARRAVARHAIIRVERRLVTADGHLALNATRGQIERIAALHEPALAPLLVDALAQPSVAAAALEGLRSLGDAAWVRGIEPLLASPALGATAAAVIGELAPDPVAVYVRAIERSAMSPGALGWMWRGYDRSPASSRKLLVGEIVRSMLHDDRPIGEVDTVQQRERTVSDRALDDLPTLVGVQLARPHNDEQRRADITAWETWWAACNRVRARP